MSHYIQQPQLQQGLPVPPNFVVPDAWINNPLHNPPNIQLAAPGPAAGIERNILGALLEYLQNQAQVSAVRCFTYNMMSRNGYVNNEFDELVNTVFVLTAALLDSGQFDRGGPAATFASERMVDFACVRFANEYPELRNMDPDLAANANQIYDVGSELGNLVNAYRSHLQQQQQQPQFGGGNIQFGGQSQRIPMGNPGNQLSQRIPMGNTNSRQAQVNPRNSSPGGPSSINTDIYNNKPRAPQQSVQQPIRNNSVRKNSLFTPKRAEQQRPAEPVQETQEQAPAPTPVHRPTPTPTQHPTGDTVHKKEKPSDEARWVICPEYCKVEYLKPSPDPEGLRVLLYEAQMLKPAYQIIGNVVKSTVTEREERMSAGYELHELAFTKDAKRRIGIWGKRPAVDEVYSRGDLLKATSEEELIDVVPYYQETMSGGALSDLTLVSIEAMRKAVEEDTAVMVISYEEKKTIQSNEDIRELLLAIKKCENISEVVVKVKDLLDDHEYMYTWLDLAFTKLTNKVLMEDYGLPIDIDSFVGDAPSLSGIVNEEITQGVVDAMRKRVVERIKVFLGTIGYIEGGEDTWGMCNITHNHRIIDIPIISQQLYLAGAESMGRLTKVTAPMIHKLIAGAVGDTPTDHYYWLRTRDGVILELVPAPGKNTDWIVVQRDKLGH